MPIIGLTDRTPSFKEIGRLRLGIPKSQALVSGPKEIAHFRPDFRPDAMSAAAVFTEIYGTTPTEIHIRLPFTDISRCWDAFYMVYNKTGLLGMADGQKWLYLRDQTGRLKVKDGHVSLADDDLPVDQYGVPYMPFDKNIPVYSYTNAKGAEVAVYAKPEGRLKVLIPELKRAAFVTVITHSVYNVMKISEQLAGIEQVAKSAGLSLPLVPMILSRRKEVISVSINGKKALQEHYLLNIEIDPTWMEAQFKYLDTVMPGILTAPAMLNLPELPTPAEVAEIDEPEQEIEPGDWPEEGDPAWKAGITELTEAQEPPKSAMSLETAESVVNSKSVRYGDMDSKTLQDHIKWIDKALKDPKTPPEHIEELEYKLDAIKTILAHRSNQPELIPTA